MRIKCDPLKWRINFNSSWFVTLENYYTMNGFDGSTMANDERQRWIAICVRFLLLLHLLCFVMVKRLGIESIKRIKMCVCVCVWARASATVQKRWRIVRTEIWFKYWIINKYYNKLSFLRLFRLVLVRLNVTFVAIIRLFNFDCFLSSLRHGVSHTLGLGIYPRMNRCS